MLAMPICRQTFALRWATPRLSRSLVQHAVGRPIPSARDGIASPQDFLQKIGRSLETKISVEEWDAFWKTGPAQLKKEGLAVKERKYALWCMNKYRRGYQIEEFAHEPRPKKTLRGRGPKIVDGKINRSKQHKG